MRPSDLPNRLMIFGASTRAAAQSAVRAGLRPICVDRFADDDLYEIADVVPLPNYPDGLVAVVENLPSVPWIYTGALENQPALLRKLATLRSLWGNPAEVVEAVRDPVRLCETLRQAGLPALPVRDCQSPPPADGAWLIKPRRGSGGRGIHVWQESMSPSDLWDEPHYFQQRASGLSISALFLATAAGSALIGASEQLIGLPELFAGPFGYCGASGPITLPLAVRLQIDRTGTAIGDAFRLRGLFGIDFVLAGDAAWPTEVNPRYPASVEVYESVIDLPLLEWHARACLTNDSESDAKPVLEQFRAKLGQAELFRAGRTSTKAIVYAPFDFAAPDLVELARSPVFTSSGVQIADRPKQGSLVPEKTPVCTLMAKGARTPGLPGLSGALAALVDAFGRNRVAG